MTKAEVIAIIAEHTKQDKEEVANTLESFFKVVQTSMIEGNNIYIRGFGSFVNKKRAAKKARNITAKTSMVIPPHYIPSFKPSKTFVHKIKHSTVLRERLEGESSAKAPEDNANTEGKSSEA